jgi:hypothetical protein
VSEERRKPGAGLWAAGILGGLILLTVLYGLSLGPMAWVWKVTNPSTPRWLETTFDVYFVPARLVYNNGPDSVQQVMDNYVQLFVVES